jgi:STE24 endopeptidase
MSRARLRLPATIAAAVVVAEAAVLLLRPRGGSVEPAPVSAGSYFSDAEIERARRWSRPQLALGLASAALEAGALTALAARPPRILRRRRSRPVSASAVAGAAMSAGLTAATLPLGAVRHRRSVAHGLSTQGWGAWAGDIAKATALGAAFASAGSAIAVALMRRFGRTWWLPGAGVALAGGAAMLAAGPVLLDPIFNRFTPLPEGELRRDVLALADDAGVEVRQVYEADASRRTTAANAYVTGLGASRRVVLFDTLIERFAPEEVRLVVAHELAHVRHRDVVRGLLYLALVAPPAALAATRIAERLAGDPPPEEAGPASLAPLAVALGAVGAAQGIVANSLSRAIEVRADTFALSLTGAIEPFIAFQRRIALTNLADPDPPKLLHPLVGTHPTTVQRIGLAKALA